MTEAKATKRDEKQHLTPQQVWDRAVRSATRGGLTGAAAQACNVFTLMWLRTVMNYQMANGGSMTGTIKLMYKEGGVPRFYRGIIPALIQSPISRFGDTFANAGALAILEDVNMWMGLKTACASVAAGGMRILLMPIDAWKTNKQVHGGGGLQALGQKMKTNGVLCLWHGGVAQATATAVGHWPWFYTYNSLDHHLGWKDGTFGQRTLRAAAIGIAASFVSDVSSNSLRVLKTYRQTSKVPIGYLQALLEIRAKDGLFGMNGLFLRGLQTRIVSHGINSMVFTVLWKWMQHASEEKKGKASTGGDEAPGH